MPEKARKSKQKPKTSKEDVLNKRVKDFGDEVETIADRFGRRMEEHGERWDSWFHSTFGIVGPLISSIFGLVIFGLLAWVLYFVNLQVGSGLLTDINSFMMNNIGLFFFIFLFFSYTSYFSKVSPKSYRLFAPITIAAGAVIVLWIVTHAIETVNMYIANPLLSMLAFRMDEGLVPIFWLFLFVGYLVLLILMITRKTVCCAAEEVAPAKPVQSAKGEYRRLYRSGKDKILGGVCGGIAEYLGVDPVIIRLLWIIGTFAWGFGILLYIIFWIIIPRNPNHKWK